jgi:predicted ATPase
MNDPVVGCFAYMAFALWTLGYPEQALHRSRAALSLARTLAHPYSLAVTLYHAATLHQYRREFRATQEHAEAAIALSTEQGFPLFRAACTVLRGWARAVQGETEEGIAEMRQCLLAYRDAGAELSRSYFLVLLAEAYGQAGRAAEGLQVLAEARTLVDKNGERFWEAELWRCQGELVRHAACGVRNAVWTAEAYFRQALETARRQQAKLLELRAVLSLARLWQHQDKQTEASQMLVATYAWFSEGYETPDLQEARQLLHELGQ